MISTQHSQNGLVRRTPSAPILRPAAKTLVRLAFLSGLLVLALAACSPYLESNLEGTAQERAAGTLPVALELAQGERVWVSGYDNLARVSGSIKVDNLAYQKQVIVHWKGAGAWKDSAASFKRSLPGNQELWTFSSLGDAVFQPYFGGSTDFEFAIKYLVDGREYWDNNGGKNYVLHFGGAGQNPAAYPAQFALGAPQVKLLAGSYVPNGASNELSLSLGLKNLGYAKAVGVRYTTDDWATQREVAASFQLSHANGLETWALSLKLDSSVKSVKCAVYYQVNGQKYWDNNDGLNYTYGLK